jgi:hypothetical protein
MVCSIVKSKEVLGRSLKHLSKSTDLIKWFAKSLTENSSFNSR